MLTNHVPIYHEAMRNYPIDDAVITAHINESFTPHKHIIQALLIFSFFFPSKEAEAQNVSPISKRLVPFLPHKNNVELNLGTDVSIQSG